MQITINTDTDDLPAVIRMLQALHLHEARTRKRRMTNEATGETIAELTPSTVKITNDPVDITDDNLEAVITGVKPAEIYTDEALKAALAAGQHLSTGYYVDYAPETRVEAPTPEQGGGTVENYVGRAGGSGGNGQPPKSLFDSVPDVAAAGRAAAAELAKGPSVTVSDVTVDAAGLPWDERIHSGAKSKLANGNWKLRRGVDPALVASVEAELRGAPKPAACATEPATSTATPPSAVAPPASAPVPPPPPAPVPAAAPVAPKPITNAAELVAAVMDKRFTTDQVNAACRAVGVENVASLLAKQDKLPEVLKELGV